MLNYMRESIDCMTMPSMPADPSGRKLYEVQTGESNAGSLRQLVIGVGHRSDKTRIKQVHTTSNTG